MFLTYRIYKIYHNYNIEYIHDENDVKRVYKKKTLFWIFTSVLFLIKNFTISKRPNCDASINAVVPFLT
jgi:hypothetical protein